MSTLSAGIIDREIKAATGAYNATLNAIRGVVSGTDLWLKLRQKAARQAEWIEILEKKRQARLRE